MIDTHCHIDLYAEPHRIVQSCEKFGITTIGMTNLPSHFEMGYPHVAASKRVRLALGLHPLYVGKCDQENEFRIFQRNLDRTSYIGEIGLDYSSEGISTKNAQIRCFTKVLSELQGRKKILSIHSRKAEQDVLNLLNKFAINNVIFHWFSGPKESVLDILSAGYYFSINPAMIRSKSGQDIISSIPRNRLLPESDGPYVQVVSRNSEPKDVKFVYEYLSKEWEVPLDAVELIISKNFEGLLSKIRI